MKEMRLASAQLVEAVVVHKTRFQITGNVLSVAETWDSVIHTCTKGAWRIAQSEFLAENGGAECVGGTFQSLNGYGRSRIPLVISLGKLNHIGCAYEEVENSECFGGGA